MQALLYSLILLLPAVFVSPAFAAEESPPVIEIHTQIRNTNFPESDPQGLHMVNNATSRLLLALLQEAELPYEFNYSPWTRIFQLMESKPNVLGYPVARTRARENDMLWIGMIRPLKINLYGLTENEERLPTSLEEARDFQIGVLRGDAVDEYLQGLGFTNIVRFNSLENALGMLERGRFDLFPFDSVGADSILAEFDAPADLLTPLVPLEEISSGIYYALSLQSDPAIQEVLQAAYAKLISDGTYTEITGLVPGAQLAD